MIIKIFSVLFSAFNLSKEIVLMHHVKGEICIIIIQL